MTVATTATAASLEYLTGPARGTRTWLGGGTLDIALDPQGRVQVSEAGSETAAENVVARLHRSGDSYEIEALTEDPLWINGDKVDSRRLAAFDLIEFGDRGPLSRFRLHQQGDRVRRSLGDMLNDCLDYTRVSRKPRLARLTRALRDISRDFIVETTLLFRFGVILALGALAFFTYQQYRADIALQERTEQSAHRLEDFARSLTRTREEALRPADLNRLRQEMRHSLSDASERLEQLEQRSAASQRVIAEANRSIVFLQGSFGFRDIESGRMLRYLTDEEGRPLFSLRGQPRLTLEGDGEIAERSFTGTAFLINSSGVMLTNRHVAQPWEDDTSVEALRETGVEPELLRFIGYIPNLERAFAVELFKVSDETDLAVLTCSDAVSGLPFLRLSTRLPAPGEEVFVMGYPTGLITMLAQTGEGFLADLERDEALDFWQVAARLASEGFIRPLASRGIIGQRSEAILVYDAETTHGGSGGPVLDINGEVVAVNTAIIPEYGGSNFGVPVEYARRLLAQAGIDQETD